MGFWCCFGFGVDFWDICCNSLAHTRCNEKHLRNYLNSLAASSNKELNDADPQPHDALLSDLSNTDFQTFVSRSPNWPGEKDSRPMLSV